MSLVQDSGFDLQQLGGGQDDSEDIVLPQKPGDKVSSLEPMMEGEKSSDLHTLIHTATTKINIA